MVVFSFAVASLMASAVTAGTLGERQDLFSCNTARHSQEERHAFKRAIAKRQETKPDDGSLLTMISNVVVCCGQGQDNSQCPPDQAVEQQFAETNKHYAPANITFRVNKIERKQDASCGSVDLADTDTFVGLLKNNFKQGERSHVNVLYVQGRKGAFIQGVAIRPTKEIGIPGADTPEIADGAVINMQSLPKVPSTDNSIGRRFIARLFRRQEGNPSGGITKVTSHELGHSLGLDHPFVKGNAAGDAPGKSACGDGDEIPDTPAQENPTQGCPSRLGGGRTRSQQNSPFAVTPRQVGQSQDKTSSCASQGPSGNEDNMMDYATCTDAVHFTPGQIKHLREVALFRIGDLSQFPETPGEKGEKSDSNELGPGSPRPQNGSPTPGGRQPQDDSASQGGGRRQNSSVFPGAPRTQDPSFPGTSRPQDNSVLPGSPQSQDPSFPGTSQPQDNSLRPASPQTQDPSFPGSSQPQDNSVLPGGPPPQEDIFQQVQSSSDQTSPLDDAEISRVINLMESSGFLDKRDAKNVPNPGQYLDAERRSVDTLPRAVEGKPDLSKLLIVDRRSVDKPAPRAVEGKPDLSKLLIVDRRNAELSPRAVDGDKKPLVNFIVDRRGLGTSPRAVQESKNRVPNLIVDRRAVKSA